MDAVLLPLRGLVLFPGATLVIPVGRPTSVKAIDLHVNGALPLVVVPQLDAGDEEIRQAPLASAGVMATVRQVANLPDGTCRVLVQGNERIEVKGVPFAADGAMMVRVESPAEEDDDPILVRAMGRQIWAMYADYRVATGIPIDDHTALSPPADKPERLAHTAAATVEMTESERVALLEAPTLHARLELLLELLATALAHIQIHSEVQAKVQAAVDTSQREYHLKEQMKAIRAELGDAEGGEAEADRFEERINAANMPKEAHDEAIREVSRMRRIQSDAAEYNIIRTWLETVCDVPWSITTDDDTSLKAAAGVLDEDHYALWKVKERILEYLAVRQLQPKSKGAILCFVGAPGVGKTSLGRSIARALGRNFARIALGGIKDESEIRGHRRTYVGALPGRLVRGLIRAGSANPVIVLDELDKVGNDFRGDPASALLEVLDPEQNSSFIDHYLDVPVDLSQTLFIATANQIDPIPPALTDRLEIIEIPGYTVEEKCHIARRFLMPRLAENHGLRAEQLSLSNGALKQIIRDYTREAGLRDLERQLASLYRKVARRVVEGNNRPARIAERTVTRYLGPPRYYQELADTAEIPGVVVGLAWTAAGGDILFVESTRMDAGNGGSGPVLKLTGSLGDVMKESAEAAMSWLRAHSSTLGLTAADFHAHFHLHVPAGAIPKDGPSAGVTMVTSLASVMTGRAVRPRLAMTGEMTLRGKVLPVGGIKEKILAARRAGVTHVILPEHNRSDLLDIPSAVRRDMQFHYVDRIESVLEYALNAPPISRSD